MRKISCSETNFFFSVTFVPSVLNSGKDFNTEGTEATEGRSSNYEVNCKARSPNRIVGLHESPFDSTQDKPVKSHQSQLSVSRRG